MKKSKVDPRAYTALRDQGFSNREIGALLRVDEASVRRGLRSRGYRPPSRLRELLLEMADVLDERGL